MGWDLRNKCRNMTRGSFLVLLHEFSPSIAIRRRPSLFGDFISSCFPAGVSPRTTGRSSLPLLKLPSTNYLYSRCCEEVVLLTINTGTARLQLATSVWIWLEGRRELGWCFCFWYTLYRAVYSAWFISSLPHILVLINLQGGTNHDTTVQYILAERGVLHPAFWFRPARCGEHEGGLGVSPRAVEYRRGRTLSLFLVLPLSFSSSSPPGPYT